MQRFVRSILLVSICAALVAGCTSSKSSTQSTSGTTASPPASQDAVHVSMIVADLSILTQQHRAPDIGDPGKVAKAVVDSNASSAIRMHVAG